MIILYGRYGMKVLAYKVTQNSVACTVQNAHAAHTDKCSVVNKVHDGLDSLITTHSAHVNIGLEGQLAVVYVVMSLLADICGNLRLFIPAVTLAMFQTV